MLEIAAILKADSFHEYFFYAFSFGDFVNNHNQKIGHKPH